MSVFNASGLCCVDKPRGFSFLRLSSFGHAIISIPSLMIKTLGYAHMWVHMTHVMSQGVSRE
jgi:hypothetical protein